MILKFTDGKINDSGATVMNAVYLANGYEDISDENIPFDEEGNLFPYYLRTGDVFTRDLVIIKMVEKPTQNEAVLTLWG